MSLINNTRAIVQSARQAASTHTSPERGTRVVCNSHPQSFLRH